MEKLDILWKSLALIKTKTATYSSDEISYIDQVIIMNGLFL